ncbi:uncharacterized protein EDB91DRAFT_1152520 [Suillus paluster]|uniref:uncharacterized protein n=1 Tax=Suillus paluster TaxID=48578 RepID=UPI001B86B704|nr:uncharacterized protein EDB91DRAFT_1152520 [Suillus paluster]KAG1732266.1 hypothetical protein EDB91DRAFT_1152520 [Suillus paluster]
MSFQKGPRFVPEKISDVPGPNTYSLPEDQLDTYKRSAFLEKTDRFSKEKKSSAAKHASDDRYATLLKKIEELEKVHIDGKKAHQTEMDRSKFEVARERLEKLKKHNEILELRIQECRRGNAADQSDLRSCVSNFACPNMSAHNSSASRGRAVTQRRHYRVSRQEEERRSTGTLYLQREEERIAGKPGQRGLPNACQALSSLRDQAENQEIDFCSPYLDPYRSVLSRVAEEYGRLATTSIAASNHAALVKDHTTLQLSSVKSSSSQTSSATRRKKLCSCAKNLRDIREESLLAFHGVLEKQHEVNRALIDQLARNSAERNILQAELAKAQVEITAGQRALADVQISLTEGREEQHRLQRRVEELEKDLRDTAASHKQALQRERDTSQKLSDALHVNKIAEGALKADIEQLHAELADTEALVARNNLAEEEAENLSKFNAEILSHNNPAQRILYVDRIRRELAEVKQTLLVCTRDRDVMSAANEDLRHEVMMYNKPRTNLTRVTRPPLTSQNINIVATTSIPPCVASDAVISKATVLEHIPGDMTLDELI